MKLSPENLDQLKEMLSQRSTWPTDDVRTLIHQEFGVEYTLKQIRIILKKFDMTYGNPFTRDYRRPDDAEDLLKKPSRYNSRDGDWIPG
jgi:putative transposase